MAIEASTIEHRSISEQVRDDLKSHISCGKLVAGDRLPSEKECCALYNVSRATVREAFRLLEQEKLIEVRHGSGRYVHPAATVAAQGSVNLIRSTRDYLRMLGHQPQVQCLGACIRTATPEEANIFGEQSAEGVVEVGRAYISEGELLNYAINVFAPSSLLVPYHQIDWQVSVAEMFAGMGREMASAVTSISAVNLPADLKERYDVPSDTTWLQFEGPIYDQKGAPMWWSRDVTRGDIRVLQVINSRAS